MPKTEILSDSGQDLNPLYGLRRIAFGPVNDAVRLISSAGEISKSKISKLDLFSVSEIKQNKDGCLEIKFYNRLAALELLLNYDREQTSTPAAETFYNALESAAKSACDAGAD